MSLFITFEGGEGAGKTTQIQLLQSRFIDAVITREPGGTELFEQIRGLLLNNKEIKNPLVELLLLSAGRVDHINKLIKPSLENGKMVICDRFFHSTIVYQCMVKGLDINVYQKISDYTIGSFQPDVTFYLDIDPKVALSRLDGRKQDRNHYDNMDISFHNKIREAYKSFASDRFIIIDASRPIDEVHEEIVRYLGNKFEFKSDK